MTLRPEPYRHLETDVIFSGLDRLAAAARDRGVAPSVLALAWVLAQPRVDAAIVGARRAAHLDEALAALDLRLSAQDLSEMAALFE
jgi:aryl-alcohol dehydrogenase (NADP+)